LGMIFSNGWVKNVCDNDEYNNNWNDAIV
jgi:hypothetical protein